LFCSKQRLRMKNQYILFVMFLLTGRMAVGQDVGSTGRFGNGGKTDNKPFVGVGIAIPLYKLFSPKKVKPLPVWDKYRALELPDSTIATKQSARATTNSSDSAIINGDEIGTSTNIIVPNIHDYEQVPSGNDSDPIWWEGVSQLGEVVIRYTRPQDPWRYSPYYAGSNPGEYYTSRLPTPSGGGAGSGNSSGSADPIKAKVVGRDSFNEDTDYRIYTTACQAYDYLFLTGVTKDYEVGAFVTVDGAIIILPNNSAVMTADGRRSVKFPPVYKDPGTSTWYIKTDDGKVYISGAIHTHPNSVYPTGPQGGSVTPSTKDKDYAASVPGLDFFILTNLSMVQFNSSGSISSMGNIFNLGCH
jgi:hypothetical protein